MESRLDTARLSRLLEIGHRLMAMRHPDEVLREVLVAAKELTGARYAALGVLNENGTGLDRFLTEGVSEEVRKRIGQYPRGHGIIGELIRNPRPLRLRRISDHPRSYGFPAHHPEMETFLGVPVMIEGRVYGNFYLTDKVGAGEFDEEDEELLMVLADWAAVAIDNARTHARGRRRRGELEQAVRGLEATVALDREVGGETDLDRVLELVAKRGRALVDARSMVVLLLDGDLRVASVAGELDSDLVGKTLPAGASPATDVLRAGRGELVGDTAVRRFEPLGIGAGTALLAPLRWRGDDIGVLCAFDRFDGADDFTTDDLLAMESFATSAANAIAATQALADERTKLAIASSERERERWARELHDETLQELGALSVLHESALQSDDPERAREALRRSREYVDKIIADLHGLITELRPASLGQLGVAAALETLIRRFEDRSDLTIEADIDLAYAKGRETTRLTPELETTIYRTVQEALNNVIKHADATTAQVSVEERDRMVRITVSDDGRGFDVDAAHEGFGLMGMRERVGLAGGEIDLRSTPGEGTRIEISLPVERVDS